MKGDLRQDTSLFGRTAELYRLVINLQRGRHTLLVGEKGTGKSRLMHEAKWILSGRTRRIDFSAGILSRLHGELGVRINPAHYRILFIYHSSPLGDCLGEIAENLFYNNDLPLDLGEERSDWGAARKQLSGLGCIKLQALIFEGISRSDKPYLIFFDNLDRITQNQNAFIETVLNIAVVCSAVVQIKENYMFKRVWASFDKIELNPLPEQESAQMINYYLQNYPLNVIDPELYKRELLKASGGNPFQIKNMLWHSWRQKFIDHVDIQKLQCVEEGEYFNMGPVYIFGLAIFTLFKIFSVGADNTEFTIYFSALGFIAYLVFRVFRGFFVFRPQKYK